MNGPDRLRVAILIVGFCNPLDLKACLSALAQSSAGPTFDIFVCENGGSEAYARLCEALLDPTGPCRPCNGERPDPVGPASGRLVKLECLALKDRDATVWVGCANQNLGYAGGVNVWLERLLPISRFTGFWIVNPDAEPDPGALRALVERSQMANKGMVGSTIVPTDNHDFVYCRAGHHWRKLRTSLALVGHGQSRAAPIDLVALEATLDCISGASLYVTRACLEDIGFMDERFFLYYEDADWSARAKSTVWVTHPTRSSSMKEAPRSDRLAFGLKDHASPFIWKAVIICISFACTGQPTCLSPCCSALSRRFCIFLSFRRTMPELQSPACWPASEERPVSRGSVSWLRMRSGARSATSRLPQSNLSDPFAGSQPQR